MKIQQDTEDSLSDYNDDLNNNSGDDGNSNDDDSDVLVQFHVSKTKQPYLLTVAFINSKFTYTTSYITGRESQVITST